MAALNGIPSESNALCQNCLNEINKEEEFYQKSLVQVPVVDGGDPVKPVKPVNVIKTIPLGIRTLTNNKTYTIKNEDDINAIKALEKRGITFIAKDVKNGELKSVKSPTYKPVRKNDEVEKAIAKTLTKKNEKVKPNYKKKKQRAIDEIKRKQRRDFIRSKIKEEKIERYKKAAREKKS